mmetsp:Transcript_7905/g.23451  ORF Transcript_7905/g.23451 Transcript_7905/m.23451 type:complete len:283 (-) Transcript_7905:97-945(-)
MAAIVKKPVGGAYGCFLAAKRPEFQKQTEGQPVSAVSKLAGVAWKALGEKERAVYEQQYKEASEKFKAFKESDDYVAPEKKAKKEKGKKAAKDKDAPKKPVGGAYGIFCNERRGEFKTQAEAAGDKSFGGGAKIASGVWKGLADAEKAKYEKKYKAAKAKYDKDMAEYKASLPEPAAEEEEEEEAAPQTKGGKRKAEPAGTKAEAKKAKTEKKAAKAAPVEPMKLDAAVLKEADGLGYRKQLENLAERKDIAALDIDGPKLLRAIKASGGLVNKAKAALLGA